MDNLNRALETLEAACESEEELRAFTPLQMADLIATVKALPDKQRAEVESRLQRIGTIIEGKLMMYQEEIEQLGGQIRNVANNNAATHAYRTVAVIPVKTDKPE